MVTNAELCQLTEQALIVSGYLDLAHAIVDGASA
jgi:hypothetical protein